MNDSVVDLQPAFILQHRNYRESSLIIDVLTRDFGIISMLAKGVKRKKSKTAGLLLAFTALKLSYLGQNELKTLTHAELDLPHIHLKGLPLYCGFYINELVSFLLHKHDPSPEVFSQYQQCLLLLAHGNPVEQTLRFFELNLIELTGYGINLTVDAKTQTCIQENKKYCYAGEQGMIESPEGYISASTLFALQQRQILNPEALSEAKQLLRRMIDFQLRGKTLKSRAVLAKIIKQL